MTDKNDTPRPSLRDKLKGLGDAFDREHRVTSAFLNRDALRALACGTEDAREGGSTLTLVIAAAGRPFVIDPAPGAARAIEAAGLSLQALYGVLLTHADPAFADEIARLSDLASLWTPAALTIHGPEDARRLVERASRPPRTGSSLTFSPVSLRPDGRALALGRAGLALAAFRADPGLGYRFDFLGRSLALTREPGRPAPAAAGPVEALIRLGASSLEVETADQCFVLAASDCIELPCASQEVGFRALGT